MTTSFTALTSPRPSHPCPSGRPGFPDRLAALQDEPAARSIEENARVLERIPVEHEQVGGHPRGDRPHLRLQPARPGRRGGCRDDPLHRRETGLHEPHELASVLAVRAGVGAHRHRNAFRAGGGDGPLGGFAQEARPLAHPLGEEVPVGDEVEDAQRRDEHDSPLGHRGEDVRPLERHLAVLERIHAGLDGQPDSREPFRMRGNAEAHPVRLVDDGRQLLGRELRRVHVLVRNGERSRRHHLHEVDTLPDLLAHGAAHPVGPVGLAVHAGKGAGARRGRRHDLPAQDEARAAADPEPDRLA